MADNYIPSPDDAFDHFATDYVAYATDNTSAVGMDADDLTALNDAVNPWSTAYAAFLAKKAAYEEAVVAKDKARAAAEAVLRAKTNAVQADPNVTDASRVGLGVPVHKTTRTSVGVPETHPVLYKVDQEHLLHRLWFSDQNTPGSKAKPKGVGGCEIRQQIVAPGGAAPTDPDAMPYLATDTKSPHRTDFEAGDVGKTAYYCQRWQNTKGQPGPWGDITGKLIT